MHNKERANIINADIS